MKRRHLKAIGAIFEMLFQKKFAHNDLDVVWKTFIVSDPCHLNCTLDDP